ncbi:DUF2177 family protein [Isobaculum melis]|uniref:Uncharacterized membrane protein n=1 Tax=Isobaculum melis TaxID=142588 RepID=A0A1H9Q781_9LACT|nr:DUF2177 family protein [Isobaculum melis]SER55703.1 Uncharacterized membrane protein [Isobaculum melis]
MNDFFKLYGVATISFLVLDLIWLLLIANKLYQHYLGGLLGQTKILPAVLFYLLYIGGMLFFAVYPGLAKDSLVYTMIAGGFLGLLCYGTYDLTNLATMKDWPVVVTILDLIWGTFVTAATSGITFYIAQHFKWG